MQIFRTVSGEEFVWWKVWGWLGLTLGNLQIFSAIAKPFLIANVNISSEYLFFILFLIGINSILMILILRFNKYAFLIATILSLNPLLWIINGIYLKNRWCHPKVNKGKPCGKYLEEEALKEFKEKVK